MNAAAIQIQQPQVQTLITMVINGVVTTFKSLQDKMDYLARMREEQA